MRLPLVIALCACLGACAGTIDKNEKTIFEPAANGHFKLIAKDQGIDFSESDRLGWLDEYIHDNGLCPNGYEINDRRQVVSSHGPLGDIITVYYYGKCKA